ncbi:MAG: DUF1615 family protein [Pseudomonadota bacterium]
MPQTARSVVVSLMCATLTVIGVCGTVPALHASEIKIRSDEPVLQRTQTGPTLPGPAPHNAPTGPRGPSINMPSAAEADARRMLQKKAELLESLEPQVAEEARIMETRVLHLDMESAYQWLTEFMVAQPLNCPRAEADKWIDAMIFATERNGLPLCKEILGITACIIAIESGFRADPYAVDRSSGNSMPQMLARAEADFQAKMGRLMMVPPIPTLYEEYKTRYHDKITACRTEGEVDAIARRIADNVKKDSERLPDFLKQIAHKGAEKLNNVVRTKGSMQLNFPRARRLMLERGERFTDRELIDYMYTVRGGVDVGVAALKPMFVQYAAHYAAPGDLSWLFFVGMDYHYGPFSSRNMMEQIRIRDMSGREITLDGDFLFYDEDGLPMEKESQTLAAAVAALNPITRDDAFRAFLAEKDRHYVYTDVHLHLASAHRAKFGETGFAVIGDLWMKPEAQIKHGHLFKTKHYLNKLDKYLNSIPWD